MLKKLTSAFPAMGERNFRLYFFGNLISFAGTFLQSTAIGWLVYQLTNSPTMVGVVAALTFVPMVLLVLFGGTITDLFDKRKLLYVTQTAAMILAFALGILTLMHIVSVLEIEIFSVLLGIVNALDNPTRISFVTQLVKDRTHLPSAQGLSSGMATAAQAIGPAIAGVLIVVIGTGWTFIINGFSFIAVLVCLLMMRFEPHVAIVRTSNTITMIKEGLRWIWSRKDVFFLFILAGLIGIFIRSYPTILPVTAKLVYHGGPKIYGWLLSTVGIGAAIGGFALSPSSKEISTKKIIIGGLAVAGIAFLGLGFTTGLAAGLFFLLINGFCYVFSISMIVSIIQHEAPKELIGRIMSVFFLVFFGGVTIGNFMIGKLTDSAGHANTAYVYGVAVILVAVVAALFKDQIPELKK